MKTRVYIFILLLLLLASFSLVSCEEEYKEGHLGGTGGNQSNNDVNQGPDGENGDTPPYMNGDPTDDFTVTLSLFGEQFMPKSEMYAYWTDGYSAHKAAFGNDGVARIDGLDGDYRVTVSGLPGVYTYDPNSPLATNTDRNVTIDIYPLNQLTGSGTGMYDCYHFSRTGVYAAEITSPDSAIFFEYAPDKNGVYTIESWIDTSEDRINPYIDVYIGTTEWKQKVGTTDGGGKTGNYTVNFIHTVKIADENISAGGQAVYTFAVKADVKDNKYPITVTFAVKRDGEFESPNASSGRNEMAVPTFDFSEFDKNEHEYSDEYAVHYPEYLYTGSTYVFDERRFKLYEISDGGDGFYHVYDKEKYPETDGYGPILYANITTVTRFIDRAFSVVEYDAASGETINAALSAGGKNYKHFIEGYTYLSTFGNVNGGSYYCVAECTCHAGKGNADWACTPDCTECHEDCRRCPAELIGNEGYQAYANSDGAAPVTEELREFLLAYATKQMFFFDGMGMLEGKNIDGKYFQAVKDSGWLFACLYYEKA